MARDVMGRGRPEERLFIRQAGFHHLENTTESEAARRQNMESFLNVAGFQKILCQYLVANG